jgi:PKD repeat protein
MGVKLPLLVLFFLLTVSCAAATHSYSSSTHTYTVSGENVNLAKLSSDIGNTAVISQSGTTWRVNCSIDATNSNIYFNDSEATKIIWDSRYSDISGGTLRTNNIAIINYRYASSRNVTKSDTGVGAITPDYAYTNNTLFSGYVHFYTDWLDGQHIDKLTILNFTDDGDNGAHSALLIDRGSNIFLSNLTLVDVYGEGIRISGTTNFCLQDAYIERCGRYNVGGGGITEENGISIHGESDRPNYNTTLRNVWVNDTSYGCINTEGDGNVYNIHTYNVSTGYSAHNSFDEHGGYGHVLDGLNCSNGLEQAALYITGYDLIVSNSKFYNAYGDGLHIDNAGTAKNITGENLTFWGPGRGLVFASCSDNIFINVTSTNWEAGDPSAQEGLYIAEAESTATNITLVDFWSNNSLYHEGISTKFINSHWVSLDADHTNKGDYYTYYYPNLIVQNNTGVPVSGAAITFNQPVKNGRGANQTTFFTDSNGKLYDNGNRTNWAAIPYQHVNIGGSTTTSQTQITASKSGKTVNSLAQTPSASWYSADPASLSGTVITLTLDVSGDVTPITPTANFNTNVTTGHNPLTVAFTDTSLNATSLAWDFTNDGSTDSTATNPTYTYTNAGTYTAKLTATNANGTDTKTATITVWKNTPTITWSNPSSITYGTALTGTQLNAAASVPGTFAYNPASGTILSAGNQSLGCTFTPTDTTNYNTTSKTVYLTVNKATPTITWSNPDNITYGTVLSSTQLNAVASVAGTKIYDPASGTLLDAGTHTLSVDFSPTDSTNYTTASKDVTINVNPINQGTNPIINSIHTFGDSYTSPIEYNSDYAHKYVSLVAANHTWTIEPDCRDGTSIPNQAEEVRTYYSHRGEGVVWNTGTGDSLYFHANEPQGRDGYGGVLESTLAWLALPQNKKVVGTNFTVVNGTWEPTPILYDNTPIMSNVIGSTIRATVTGNTVYLSYIRIARPGAKSFDLWLDGTFVNTYTCIGGETAPAGTSEYDPTLIKFTGLTNTEHNLTVRVRDIYDDYVILDWAAGFDSTSVTPNTTKVYLVNQPPHTSATYAEYGASLQDTIDIDTIIKNKVIYLNRDGLNISLVDVYPGYNAATMSGGSHDTLHPNDAGNVFMAQKLETALVNGPTLGIQPTASFTSSRTSGSAPLAVTFTDTSTNTPTSWAWDFDNDGSTDSTSQNPSYTFSTAGTYTVNFTATNDFGSSSAQSTINVSESPGTVDYNVTAYWIDANNDVWIPLDIAEGQYLNFNVSKTAGYIPNGYGVFPFFDDFTGSSLNATNWDVKSNLGLATVSGGNISVLGGSDSSYYYWMVGKTGAASGYSLMFRGNIPHLTGSDQTAQTGWNDNLGLNIRDNFDFLGFGNSATDYIQAGDGVSNYDLHAMTGQLGFGTVSNYEVTRTASETKYYLNGTNIYNSSQIATGTWYPHIVAKNTATVTMDYMALRKYSATEPTVSIVDHGTYYAVNITSDTTLTNYQLKMDGDSFGISSRADSLEFSNGEEPEPTIDVRAITSKFVNAFKNFMKNFGLHLTEAIWQTY